MQRSRCLPDIEVLRERALLKSFHNVLCRVAHRHRDIELVLSFLEVCTEARSHIRGEELKLPRLHRGDKPRPED
uniref:Hemerythrin-like domain-containing protein n=1 Tax=Physcomitrium patens TaxID=3218 RepID=A0A2K1KCA7_PHYPA|nr:hypothetical protein PHYPA_010603 [Physcomitrium patens]